LAADRCKQRAFEQIALGENVLLDCIGVGALARLDGEKLSLIVPFVERSILIKAFVALKPDQLSSVDCGKRLCHFGLADARFPFEQQRPCEEIHQPQCSRDVAIGDIADGGQPVRDVVAVQAHMNSLYRQYIWAAPDRAGAANRPPACFLTGAGRDFPRPSKSANCRAALEYWSSRGTRRRHSLHSRSTERPRHSGFRLRLSPRSGGAETAWSSNRFPTAEFRPPSAGNNPSTTPWSRCHPRRNGSPGPWRCRMLPSGRRGSDLR